MKFLTSLSLVLLTSLSTASPTRSVDQDSTCLTYQQASDIVKAYRAIVANSGNVTAQAEKLLAPNFSFTSDSFASLLGYPLGTTISRSEYITAQEKEAPITDIQTIGVGFECHAVLWQWKAFVGSHVHPIRGFTLSEHVEGGQLGPTFTEFNSIAWGEDIGGKWTPPS